MTERAHSVVYCGPLLWADDAVYESLDVGVNITGNALVTVVGLGTHCSLICASEAICSTLETRGARVSSEM